jgi:Mg/Co/Ni transporter MgtE
LVNGTEEITIEYSSKEIKQLQTEADFTGLPLEQFIKLKSLLTKTRINDNKNKVQQLTEEINQLKVRLSLYTNESSDGIYIKVDRELKAEIFEEMSNSFPDMTIDEAITYVVLNYNEDIEDAKRFEQKKAKEIIASNKIKNYEDCSKILFDKMAKLLKRKKIS